MANLSFPKTCQIRKGWEYDQIYSRGKRLRGRGFMLVCRANGSRYSRIGISVSKKIRGAVRRNRIKRIIRESFRLYRQNYPLHADIVFVVRPDFSCTSPLAIGEAVASMARDWE